MLSIVAVWQGNLQEIWLFPRSAFPGAPGRRPRIPAEILRRQGLKLARWSALVSAVGLLLLGACGGKSAPPFNSTPAISDLFPSNITVGSQDFTLSVVGSGFASGNKGVSFVYWNGFARSTTLNEITGQLQVHIFASDVAAPGTVNVTVVNPSPGGGTSLPSPFVIEPVQAGAPVVTSLSPSDVKAGSAAFTLTVNGSNFTANDPVTWNGDVRLTTFVNSNQVTANILSTDIANAGSGSVSVATPGLLIAAPSINMPINGPDNSKPAVSSIAPASASAGSTDLQVTIQGTGFVAGSFGEWNGQPLATAFISSSKLIVLIPAADLAVSTSANIDVSNPAPGGGTSGQSTFKVN